MRNLSLSLALLAAPAAAQTYEPVVVEPQIAGGPSSMIPLNLGDDGTRQVDLGFNFTYWGQTFSSAWVGSNGTVSFGTPSSLCCSGYPMEQAPRNTIYAFWTDLISYSGNPYYRRGDGSILFGWYGTTEYGVSKQYTFEIGLSSDNAIQLNYGAMPDLYYHYAAAGLTGPAAADNITLFYGRYPGILRNWSGKLAWAESEAATTVDCNLTPMDPSCPPAMVAPLQIVTSSPLVAIQDAAREDETADASDIAAAIMSEPAQEIDISPASDTQQASISQQVTSRIEERLSPDQVAALAAPLPTVAAFSALSQGSTSSGLSQSMEATSNSPSSIANTLEVLNMSAAPSTTNVVTQDAQSGNAMGAGQQETLEAMASVPAFAAYTQVALQDRPDFYAPRDVYKNRRLRDANFEMYRMTRTNTDTWQEMVDAQYGR